MKNMLSEAQLERIAFLSEELGEVQQILGKIQRHGYESFDPTKENIITNRTLLETEIGDVLAGIWMLISESDVDDTNIKNFKYIKQNKICTGKAYLHYQNLLKLKEIYEKSKI